MTAEQLLASIRAFIGLGHKTLDDVTEHVCEVDGWIDAVDLLDLLLAFVADGELEMDVTDAGVLFSVPGAVCEEVA